jgi:putative DNA primase/helicase
MAGTALYSQGNSTEAGIRQALRIDSRPVIFDESEQNNDKEVARIQNILSLIRQSSTESEAVTFRGTSGGAPMSFVIHSMFCLGSIQVGLKQQADIERISVLTLRPKREGKDGIDTSTASENWKRISAALAAVRGDPDLPAKLLHRGLKLLPVTVQNIGIFAQAAAEEFGSMREGDQYGALLAGAWSLISTQVATLEQARAMIARYDWSEYLEGSETEESDKALAALMTSLIRVKSQDVSVFELIQRAAKSESGFRDVSPAEADANLTRHGLRIEWGGSPTRATAVLVADSHTELKRLMEPTPYAADLKGQLRRLPGAAKTEKKVRFNGPGVYATRIPIGLVLDGPEQMASAPRPDNEDFDDSYFNSDAA